MSPPSLDTGECLCPFTVFLCHLPMTFCSRLWKHHIRSPHSLFLAYINAHICNQIKKHHLRDKENLQLSFKTMERSLQPLLRSEDLKSSHLFTLWAQCLEQGICFCKVLKPQKISLIPIILKSMAKKFMYLQREPNLVLVQHVIFTNCLTGTHNLIQAHTME